MFVPVLPSPWHGAMAKCCIDLGAPKKCKINPQNFSSSYRFQLFQIATNFRREILMAMQLRSATRASKAATQRAEARIIGTTPTASREMYQSRLTARLAAGGRTQCRVHGNAGGGAQLAKRGAGRRLMEKIGPISGAAHSGAISDERVQRKA